MGFQRHSTDKEKLKRRMKYHLLRQVGVSIRKARIFRDWTDNKFLMILKGEADPIR